MSPTEPFRRQPLIISGNNLSSGERSASFATGSPTSLLSSYLIFVRDLRGQRREPSIELRSDDVSVIAAHLGVTEQYVLGGLLDLMGATRAERSTMMAMLAAGALTLVLTGSFVSDLSLDGVSVDMTRLAAAVQAAATSSDDADSAVTAETGAAEFGTAPSAAATPAASSASQFTERSVETPSPDVLQSAAAARTAPVEPAEDVDGATTGAAFTDSAADVSAPAGTSAGQSGTESPGSGTQEPVSIGVTSDGSLVASVAPPVPATSDEQVATTELPDGTTVGVTAPPVPPPSAEEQVATAELPDGTVVGVAAPPVPPPAEG